MKLTKHTFFKEKCVCLKAVNRLTSLCAYVKLAFHKVCSPLNCTFTAVYIWELYTSALSNFLHICRRPAEYTDVTNSAKKQNVLISFVMGDTGSHR